ncbi:MULTISPECIES: helix-turn-helix domain-containing protein [unclassified Methanosarcina]|uniref:helix-turn-helix domain-containing protein n=1 Tax=unclassified Methanosarcina TaxID=2644672 RepID=UPI000615B6F1|nr:MULTISPECIES: cupin domain-containing protein [unclassified Methanosarcina]AKB18252.1 Transcriptional regulator, Hth-3 family [Methanosarcina sp. WWM596]AKB21576.1 Transcriptional regulator, Hth-3 family [Methanosarcina sp. WH1]
MQEKIKEIAARVRELRELSEISVEKMAGYLQVSAETYEKYENGTEDIPASILFEIAHRLQVDMATLLTGEEPRMNIFTVTRDGKGVSVERRKQYRYQNLAEKFIHKKAEFFIVIVEPKSQGTKPDTNSHPGQEFNYVLEGSLKVYIHNNEIVLNEGDSIYFDSNYEHAMEALEGKPAKFLAVIM